MKHGFLVFNPSAGMGRKSKSVVETVLRQFARQGIDVAPSPTDPDGSVMTQVRELVREKPDLMVAWGGDGTIHEVVNGLFGSKIPLGVIPGGTANVLARELKIPFHPSDAIRVIAKQKPRSISVGQADQRYFLLMVGIGFDSEVIRNVEWNLKKRIGTFAFGFSALDTARKYGYPKFSVVADGEEKECVFAVISNARYYGAYFMLTPDADISDDYLYICLFKEPGLASMFWYAFHAFKRTHMKLESVEILRATELRATGPADIAVQADGELIGYLPMKFQIHPRSLEIFCP